MSMQTHVVSTAVDLLGEILETLQESLKHNIPIVTHFPQQLEIVKGHHIKFPWNLYLGLT